MSRRTRVYGPAYLDRVLRVDRPLLDPALSGPLDRSADGCLESGVGLSIVDEVGGTIVIEPPDGWPGPTGFVRVSGRLLDGAADSSNPWNRRVVGVSWHDDLGGMGAGYAKAFGGELVSALGSESDPTSRAISERLRRAMIQHRPVRVADRPADWTLLVTSGPFGDKLAVGFRGCHASVRSFVDVTEERLPVDLVVVAAIPNPLALPVLRGAGHAVRFLAPAMRNMSDTTCPLIDLVESVDLLSCNRREWESLPDRDVVADRVPVVAITDGPRGSRILFRANSGGRGVVEIPAFPRDEPPRDTNRAGEAFASTLVTTILDSGWTPGPIDEATIVRAARRASAAAALELDMVDFAFPDPGRIDAALRDGRVIGSMPPAGAGSVLG